MLVCEIGTYDVVDYVRILTCIRKGRVPDKLQRLSQIESFAEQDASGSGQDGSNYQHSVGSAGEFFHGSSNRLYRLMNAIRPRGGYIDHKYHIGSAI